jgi:hypothetical protein
MRIGVALLMLAAGIGLWFGRADHFMNIHYGNQLLWVPASPLLMAYGTWDLIKELIWRVQRRQSRQRREL